MKIIRFALIVAMTSIVGLAAQSVSRPAFLHWSKKTVVKSPDKKLQIEVHPILTDEENHSPVVVHRLYDGKEWNLFTLKRAAQAIWRPDSQRILVIDEPTADNYQVYLFSPEGQRIETDTDKTMRAAVASHIGSDGKIEFYLPTFVSWKDHELVIAAGGTSSKEVPGPMESFCFAVSIDSNSGQLLTTKKQSDSLCRLNP
jgi:hypothetical protein